MGTATPPGQGQPGSGRAAGQPRRGTERGRKQILKRSARSGLDRLLFVSHLPTAGSTGHRPARRRGVPAGRSASCSRPPFFTATGGTRRLASSPGPTPPRASPHFLSLPPPPLLPCTLLLPECPSRPPRRRPHSPTSWPRPCHRISPPARPGGLSAAAALGPPWPLPWWLPGWALRAPRRERKAGGDVRLAAHGWREQEPSAEPPAVLRGAGLCGAGLCGAGQCRAGLCRAALAPLPRPPAALPDRPRRVRLGASRCCRRPRLRAGKATRGRSRGAAGEGRGRRSPALYF